MAGADDFADYPKGQLSQGAGDLIDVVDINVQWEDGEKVVQTIRQNPAGSTHGGKSTKLTFTTAVSHAGFERDWLGKYEKRAVEEYRLKVPGLTIVIVGRLTSPTIVSTVDDYIKFTISVVARYKKA